jgi:ribosome-binding factor A
MANYLQHQVPESMPALASVTAVDVTSDLRKAAVYFRLVGTSEDGLKSQSILEKHRKAFQARVARELKTKFCPVLEFRFGQARQEDDVDRLLAQLNRRKDWD